MRMNTGGSKVYGSGFEEKHFSSTTTHCCTYRWAALGSLPHQIKLVCLWGRRKRSSIFITQNVDAELFTITSLTFRGYSFHLEKVPLGGQMAMSAWKAAFSSYLPKSHQHPVLTRLSPRCSSKILGSRASFLGPGGPKPEAYITSSFSNCSTASCSVNS